MRMTLPLCTWTLVALSLPPAIAAMANPAKMEKTAIGRVLANKDGMTLYTFGKDGRDRSECTGSCAVNWPPFLAPADATSSGDWTLVTRQNGEKQWAYKGKPLYTFAKDHKPGQANGNGLLHGAWEAARPGKA